VYIDDVTSTSVTIFWTTNTTSTGLVRYGVTKPPTQPSDSTGPGTTHRVELKNLTPGVTYWFQIEATDSSGTYIDTNSDSYYDFTTASPAEYSITLSPTCGVCGELYEVGRCNEIIEATAVVAAAGTYHVCWDARAEGNVVATFTASGPGIYSRLTFYMPEAKRGSHTVYLTDSTYTEKASAVFTVSPSVKISPEKGPVGTTVSLNGYGFDASQQIQVTLFQGDVAKGEMKSATADATKGSWTVSYTIPATPAGHYVFKIQAKEGTDWPVWVIKDFEVTPKIAINPDSGTVGQGVDVTGTGFASKEGNIQISFAGNVIKKNIFADEDGSWHDYIAVPALRSGRYIVDASGASTRARDVPDVIFTLVAGISVNPGTGYVGDTITVAGGGFAPGEKGITVTFDAAVVASDITADINGCWESSFNLPVSTYGSHTVGASGETTKPAVTTTLSTKARIEGIGPTEAAPGDSVSITGTGFHGSQKLTITVGSATATENLQSGPNGNVAISFRVPKGATAGRQMVRVTDADGATDSVEFTVTKKALPTPLRMSPEGSTLRSGIVTFRWQGIASGSGITYIVEISQSPSFITGVMSESAGTELSYTLPKERALSKGTYYWRVKAKDDYGNESEFSASDYSTFTVSPIPTWVWVVVGVVVLIGLMVVAYRETKFKVAE
jgi:hypothetical protein